MRTYKLIIECGEDCSETILPARGGCNLPMDDRGARNWVRARAAGRAVEITDCDEIEQGVRVIARVHADADDESPALSGRLIVC